jgi:hypothetical protein
MTLKSLLQQIQYLLKVISEGPGMDKGKAGIVLTLQPLQRVKVMEC